MSLRLGGRYATMQLLSKAAMEKLPTPRLLAYYKKLRRCGTSVNMDHQDWERTMADAKAILDQREHVQ
jgi:hypothetical protein